MFYFHCKFQTDRSGDKIAVLRFKANRIKLHDGSKTKSRKVNPFLKGEIGKPERLIFCTNSNCVIVKGFVIIIIDQCTWSRLLSST